MSSLRLAIKRSADEAAALAPKPPPISVRKTTQACSIERFIAKGLLRPWNGSHNEVCEVCGLSGSLIACSFCNLACHNDSECIGNIVPESADGVWACRACWRYACTEELLARRRILLWTAPHGNACAACHSSDNSPLPSPLPTNDSQRQPEISSSHSHNDENSAGCTDVTVSPYSPSPSSLSSLSSTQGLHSATDASKHADVNAVLSLACACCDLWYHTRKECAGPFAQRGAHHNNSSSTSSSIKARGCGSSSGDGAGHWLCPLCWADNAPSDACPWNESFLAVEEGSLAQSTPQSENPYRRPYSNSRRGDIVTVTNPQHDTQSVLPTSASEVDLSGSTPGAAAITGAPTAVNSGLIEAIGKESYVSEQSAQRPKLSAQYDHAITAEDLSYKRFDPLAALPDVLLLTKVFWLLEAPDLGRCLSVSSSWRTWVSHGAGPKHWDPLVRLALVPSIASTSTPTSAAGTTVRSLSTDTASASKIDLTDFRLHVEEIPFAASLDAPTARRDYWQHGHNHRCEHCGMGGELICCDFCNVVYHLGCLPVPLLEAPEGDWACPSCATDHRAPLMGPCYASVFTTSSSGGGGNADVASRDGMETDVRRRFPDDSKIRLGGVSLPNDKADRLVIIGGYHSQSFTPNVGVYCLPLNLSTSSSSSSYSNATLDLNEKSSHNDRISSFDNRVLLSSSNRLAETADNSSGPVDNGSDTASVNGDTLPEWAYLQCSDSGPDFFFGSEQCFLICPGFLGVFPWVNGSSNKVLEARGQVGFSSIYMLDLSTGRWSQKKLRGHIPSPRTSFALARFKTASAAALGDALGSFSSSSSSSSSTSLLPKLMPSDHLVLSGGEGLGRTLLTADAYVLRLDTMTWIASPSLHANSPSLKTSNHVGLAESGSSIDGPGNGSATIGTASARLPRKKKKVEVASSFDATKPETTRVDSMRPRAGHSLTSVGGNRVLSFGGYGKSSSSQNTKTNQPRSNNSNRSGSASSSSSSGGGSRGYCNDVHVLELTFRDASKDVARNRPAQPTAPPTWSGNFGSNHGNSNEWQGQWRLLECKGRLPPPRAHHSAIAIGPFVAIVGGTTSHELKPVASPLFLLHTPTVTWTSLAPQPVPAPLRCSNLPSSQPSAAPSPRMRPALSIWPGQGLLVFGGGPWQCLESTDSATEHDADAYLLRIDTASA